VRQRHEDAIANPVVASTRHPGPVAHRDLTYPEAFHCDERGEEAVDSLEEADVREAFAPERAVRATGIADVPAAETDPHAVAHARRERPEPVVTAPPRLHPGPADAIGVVE